VQIRFVDWVQGWNNLSKGDGTLQTSKKKKKKKKNVFLLKIKKMQHNKTKGLKISKN